MRNKYVGFFCLLFLICVASVNATIEKSMKILMIVGTFPKIHDICMLNQITGLIDRGHDVHIYAMSRGDFSYVQPEIITYNLINKTIFEELPSSLNEYDIVVFQLGHKLFRP